MGTKMGPSYANLFVGIMEHHQFSVYTEAPNLNSTVATLTIALAHCVIHIRIHHTLRIPYLFHSFSDFVIYVVAILVFPTNKRQCASFSIYVAILFLSFK